MRRLRGQGCGACFVNTIRLCTLEFLSGSSPKGLVITHIFSEVGGSFNCVLRVGRKRLSPDAKGVIHTSPGQRPTAIDID
jgi:hypothetical protein